MTVDEFRPLAIRLTQAGLVAWPSLPSGAPPWMRSKMEEWARALSDLPGSEVEAAVDVMVRTEREPIRHPGAVRALVMRHRSEAAKAPTPFRNATTRTYACSCCVDTGCVAARVCTDGGAEYQMLFPCRCEAGKAIALHARPLREGASVIARWETLHGEVDAMGAGSGVPDTGVL